MTAFTTYPVAAKVHPCVRNRGCRVQPGERYVRVAWPPWTMVHDDPDDAPWPMGEWLVESFHPACSDEPW